jgi:hypothetical protein
MALLTDPAAPITVLVPTNDAFAELGDDLDLSRRAMLTDPLSAVVLRTHVLNFDQSLKSVYPAVNTTNVLGQRVVLASPSGVAAAAAAAADEAASPAPAPAPALAAAETAVTPRSAAPRKAGGGGGARRLAQAKTVILADDGSATVTNVTGGGGGSGSGDAGVGGFAPFLSAIAGLFGSLFTSNPSSSSSSPMTGVTTTPSYAAAKAKHTCVGGCVSAKDWRAVAGGRNASILAGNGRTCSGYVHAVDTVLLPALIEQKGGKGKASVFVVGDGVTGKKAAVVTVPASLASANVTVALEGAAAAAKKGAPAPAPADTADDAAAAPPAIAGATLAPKGARVVEPKGKAAAAAAPEPAPKKKGGVPA